MRLCWPTDFHTSALWGHWMQSRGPAEQSRRREREREKERERESQGTLCYQCDLTRKMRLRMKMKRRRRRRIMINRLILRQILNQRGVSNLKNSKNKIKKLLNGLKHFHSFKVDFLIMKYHETIAGTKVQVTSFIVCIGFNHLSVPQDTKLNQLNIHSAISCHEIYFEKTIRL